MADARSPRRSKDLCALLGYSDKGKASSILDISKACKFFTTRWHHDHDRKNPSSNKSKANRDDASKVHPVDPLAKFESCRTFRIIVFCFLENFK